MKWLVIAVGTLILQNSSTGKSSWDYTEYKQTTYKNFREQKKFHQQMNLDEVDYPLLHAAIFFVTNEVRTNKGLEPLQFNLNLEIAAWHHSKAMAERDFFNHNNVYDAKRRTPNDRAKLAGISNPFLAENVAETSALQYQSGEEIYILDKKNGVFSHEDGGEPIEPQTYIRVAEIVVDQWMNSKPHRKNILSKEGLQMGCGAYLYKDKRFYNMPTFKLTQNFQWYEAVKPVEPVDKAPQ